MIDEQELWACAHFVLTHHADDPRAFIVERIAALAVAGDEKGIATWQAIGRRVEELSTNAAVIH